jgi:hypothetical protein
MLLNSDATRAGDRHRRTERRAKRRQELASLFIGEAQSIAFRLVALNDQAPQSGAGRKRPVRKHLTDAGELQSMLPVTRMMYG